MDETMFFNEGQVAVSNARFMVFGRTYAMNAVVSVRSWTQSPNIIMPVLLIGVSILTLLGAFFGGSWFAGIIGCLFLGLGILWAKRKKLSYVVVLSTSSGEVQALTSEDYKYISRVVDSLNQAIVARG